MKDDGKREAVHVCTLKRKGKVERIELPLLVASLQRMQRQRPVLWMAVAARSIHPYAPRPWRQSVACVREESALHSAEHADDARHHVLVLVQTCVVAADRVEVVASAGVVRTPSHSVTRKTYGAVVACHVTWTTRVNNWHDDLLPAM